MKTDQSSPHPTLMFIRGMYGSGKSYLAEVLRQALGATQVMLLDPDAIDYDGQAYRALSKSLDAEGLDTTIHPFRFLRGQAYDGIATGKVVIWNQPFTNRGMFSRLVENLQAYALERGIRLPVLVVEVEIDPAVAKDRVAQRKQAGGHGPSDKTLAERIRGYESFASDGYTTVAVSGTDDVAVSVETVLQTLRTL